MLGLAQEKKRCTKHNSVLGDNHFLSVYMFPWVFVWRGREEIKSQMNIVRLKRNIDIDNCQRCLMRNASREYSRDLHLTLQMETPQLHSSCHCTNFCTQNNKMLPNVNSEIVQVREWFHKHQTNKIFAAVSLVSTSTKMFYDCMRN